MYINMILQFIVYILQKLLEFPTISAAENVTFKRLEIQQKHV